MHARNIKDLSIALEALTRVPRSDTLMGQVDLLLIHEIDKLREEQHPPVIYHPPKKMDEEMPF